MEKIFEEFSKKIRTTEEIVIFLDNISQVQKIVFKEREKTLTKILKGKISQEFEKFLERLERENLIGKTPEEKFSFFEKLKEYLKNLPRMKLEIAFSPSKEFLEKISSLIEKDFGQKIVFDLTLNPKIVAGAIIEFGGKYFDFSISKEIEEIFRHPH